MPPRLTVELVPKTCWFSNLRDHLDKPTWNFIRRQIYAKAMYTCQICGMRNIQLECHEVWYYDDKHKIQQLAGLAALCPMCHAVKHIGHARLSGKYEQALQHLMRMNGWNENQAKKHIAKAFEKAKERGQYNWQLDLRWLAANYGIYVASKRKSRPK